MACALTLADLPPSPAVGTPARSGEGSGACARWRALLGGPEPATPVSPCRKHRGLSPTARDNRSKSAGGAHASSLHLQLHFQYISFRSHFTNNICPQSLKIKKWVREARRCPRSGSCPHGREWRGRGLCFAGTGGMRPGKTALGPDRWPGAEGRGGCEPSRRPDVRGDRVTAQPPPPAHRPTGKRAGGRPGRRACAVTVAAPGHPWGRCSPCVS